MPPLFRCSILATTLLGVGCAGSASVSRTPVPPSRPAQTLEAPPHGTRSSAAHRSSAPSSSTGVAGAVASEPEAGSIDDLADLERHALGGNGIIARLIHEQRALAATADGTRAWPAPRLSYRESLVEVETRVGPQERTFSLEQMIPWPGTLDAQEDRARLRAAMTGDELEDARRAVLARVRGLWAELGSVTRSIAVRRETLALVDTLLAAVRDRIAAGTGRPSHAVRLEIERARIADEITTLSERMEPLHVALRAATGLPEGTPIPPASGTDRRPLRGDRETLAATLETGDPRLARAGRDIALAETEAEIARLAGYPKVGVGVTTIITGDAVQPNVRGSGDDPWMVGIALEVPVDRRAVRSALRAAEDRRDGAVFAHEQLRRDRLALLDEVLFRRDDLERRITLHRDTLVPRATEALELSRGGYAGGAIPLTDLLDAERTLLDLRLALVRAEADRLRVDAELRALVGEPDGANP